MTEQALGRGEREAKGGGERSHPRSNIVALLRARELAATGACDRIVGWADAIARWLEE
jgi:hypothetical protein